jgi:hypothetical protein
MKDIRIYVMAHKAFEPPKDSIYIPLQVGAALHEPLGYLADNTGDNISAKNPNYNELTGLYWMWKNGPECDITGLCHYRRFFLNDEEELLGAADYERLLGEYDAVVTPGLIYPQGKTVYNAYGEKHYTKDLDLTRNAVAKHYPDCLKVYDDVMNGRGMYYANMLVTSKKLMDEYSKWLFTVLFEVEKHINMTGYDDYDRRVYGFIAERLLLVWLRYRSLRVYEAPVGLMSAKSETAEVIDRSAQILKTGNFKEVLSYLKEINLRRPDLFFKDSDTNGELAAIYTLAEIMSAEERAGKSNLVSYSTDYRELTRIYAGLRQRITEYEQANELFSYITEYNLSIEFVALAVTKVYEGKEDRIRVYNALANAYLDRKDINMARMYVGLALKEG